MDIRGRRGILAGTLEEAIMSEESRAAFLATPVERPSPGAYTPRERLLRILRGEQVDRLPIIPTGMSPFTWHTDYEVYHPVLRVAQRHCEFMAGYGLAGGLNLCDPAALDMTTERSQEGERKIHRTTLRTPKGDLTQVRVSDPAVGGASTTRFFVESEEELERFESLPFEPYRPDISDLGDFNALVGDAGLPYCNGVQNALIGATGMMGEEFRILFCALEKDRLRKMVERQQERVLAYVGMLLDQMDAINQRDQGSGIRDQTGAGRAQGADSLPLTPLFRFYAIEPFVEPIQPPSFIDEFVVPYDREVIQLIHDRGGYAVMHCHGRLKAQIPRMVQIGVDGVDCVESPPSNDATLTEMMQMADGRLFLWGYVQYEDLAHQTPDQIEGQVRRAVEAGGTAGRYVLGQAASPWSAHLVGDTQSNWIHMIECGARYGGH